MLRDIFKKNQNSKNDIPKIIAEIGVHHNGDMELAKKYIDEAQKNGADAVKFQSYKAETISTKTAPSYWDLKKNPIDSQFKLFSQNDSFWKKEFEELKRYSDRNGIEFLSTPFDFESATFLNDLCDVFKISSSDLNNRPFIEYISGFKKPIFLSTGAALNNEITETLSWIFRAGVDQICLLHCVLNYPTKNENANLNRIRFFQNKYQNCEIGYSDHTLPEDLSCLISSVILGSKVIEKHFTLDKNLPGNDHFHAFDPVDLKKFKNLIHGFVEFLGDGTENIDSQLMSRKNARRSCVSLGKITKGSKIEKQMITFKRPGTGIEPKYVDQIVGKVAKDDIEDDTTILFNMLK